MDPGEKNKNYNYVCCIIPLAGGATAKNGSMDPRMESWIQVISLKHELQMNKYVNAYK